MMVLIVHTFLVVLVWHAKINLNYADNTHVNVYNILKAYTCSQVGCAFIFVSKTGVLCAIDDVASLQIVKSNLLLFSRAGYAS